VYHQASATPGCRGRSLVCGALLLAGVATAARAQSPAPAPTAAEEPAVETFYEAIQVRLGEVEVVVTDRQGNRVTGLTRDDFALFEDGERVEITSFAAFAPTPSASVAAPTSGASDGAEASADAGAVVVVLVDNQSLTLSGRKRLLERVRALVRTGLGAGNRFAVAIQDDPGSLRMVLAPTDDTAAVLAALDRAEEVAPGGQRMYGETARLVRSLQTSLNPAGALTQSRAESQAPEDMEEAEGRSLYEQIRSLTRQLEGQALSTAAALEQLVQAVGGLPGRKVVLLVSGGIPQRPGEALVSAWRNRYDSVPSLRNVSRSFDEREGDVGSTLRRAAAHANGSRVVIYGLASPAAPSSVSAEMAGGEVWTSTEEWTATMNLRESVEALALPTGGVVGLEGGGAGAALDALREDLESYYSLAYVPRDRTRGQDRKLRVEVTPPGLTVRHRSSFRERTSGELMVGRTRAALLLGHQDDALGLTVDVGVPVESDQRNVSELPMTISLPLAELVLLPQGQFHEGRMRIYIASTDEKGRSSPVTEIDVPVRVPNDQLLAALSRHVGYRTRLAIRDTRQRIAVTVRDELSHQSATRFVEHPPTDSTGPPATPAPRDGSR
jgi:VWFA-related protein